MEGLSKHYNPNEVEDKLYAEWMENDCFTAEIDENKTPFSIVIPPPNVTGQLHMGHALNNTIQDIIIRAKRMQGYSALWIPGVDHAGIATQGRVESELKKEKSLSRHDVGREAFVELVWDWKNKYGNIITNQLKKLGSSCDWTRERFTMDEGLSKAVKQQFIQLYNKGLIYKGQRIINWCPSCATALSDMEVDHKEKEGAFWHIRYMVKDSDEYLIVATTRPETMLGDTAVAVNPSDERYKRFIGKTLILPLVGRGIPVVADDYADASFGTGCVKVTPCHDPNDFEIGKRHNLPLINIFDKYAVVNENGGKYAGLERYAARKAVVADLEAAGLLEKIVPHTHSVGHCDRCSNVVEPIASEQWFVKMNPLAAPAIEAVRKGDVEFLPNHFEKIYLNWLENIHDWCISRQLWWGHRIPAYYCGSCGEIMVSEQDVGVCIKCGSKEIRQDEDVLDTWFSSALWPFSTLGWPEDTPDLRYFYPTSVLVTAYDIIPLWVVRMVHSALELTGKAPFSKVIINGIVRDELGRKMSKSLDNGIDPLMIIEKYGADALRFALMNGISTGVDMRFSDEKIETARNFMNKIWNAARFILMNLDGGVAEPNLTQLEIEDKWILSLLNKLIREVAENIDKYELSIALGKIYGFFWDVFCDWYIELIKPRFSSKGTLENRSAQNIIVCVFDRLLKLLHPFLPFITEEIWRSMPKPDTVTEPNFIMLADFPEYSVLEFERDESRMEKIITAIRAIRAKRAEMNVPAARKIKIFIQSAYKETFSAGSDKFFVKLAGCSNIEYVNEINSDGMTRLVTPDALIFIPVEELVDTEAEIARLEKELSATEAEIQRVQAQLSNEGFIKKAPTSVIEEKRALEAKYLAVKTALTESLAEMKGTLRE